MDTFAVVLQNGNSIKCSANHKFFTNSGWLECKNIIPNEHMILCDDNTYSYVTDVTPIGKYNIVDITVDDENHAYFGNGMLNHNSGKSLLAAHLLAETQKKGGVAVYIDTESAVSQEFLQAIGIDISKLVYVQLQLIEDVFTAIENIIEKIRTSSKDKLVTIVVDSVAAASTKTEIEADYEKDGWATTKAIVMGKALRKINDMIARQRIALIFTNQLRDKLGAMFGDTYTTSGGRALPFHASVRLRLKGVGQIKKGDDVIGIKCKALVMKNRMGPPLRQVDYDMFFASGIDNYGGWLTLLKNHEMVSQSGAWYTITDQKGEELRFQAKDWAGMLEGDAEFKEYVYNQIAETVIMKYKSATDVDLDALDVEAIKEGEME